MRKALLSRSLSLPLEEVNFPHLAYENSEIL